MNDYIIVGSGINALVAAALLGQEGKRVVVLERNDRIGGCIRTEEITAPDFISDVMAMTFVLFLMSPAYAKLGPALKKRGVSFSHTKIPTAVLLPDGRSLTFAMDRNANVAAFEKLAPGDGRRLAEDMREVEKNGRLLFTLLGNDLWSGLVLKTLAREAYSRGLRGLAAYFGECLIPARGWLETRYESELARALLAPWVLHCGLGPEAASSGQMAKVVALALEQAGAPVVTGGAAHLLKAFQRLIEDQGNTILTSADVDRVVLNDRNRAKGVRLSDGREIEGAAALFAR